MATTLLIFVVAIFNIEKIQRIFTWRKLYMENLSDALKMAAAVLIFAAALTITIYEFTIARTTSAAVMKGADNINSYYDNVNIESERIVNVNSVITNLYLYYKNYNTILFYKAGKASDGSLSNISKVTLYYTEVLEDNLNYSRLISDGRGIYGLDINDEQTRGEPWIGSGGNNEMSKRFVDALIKNVYTEEYSWSNQNINSKNSYDKSRKRLRIGFVYNNSNGFSFKDNKGYFVERIGEYNSDAKYSSGSSSSDPSYLNTTISSSSDAYKDPQTNSIVDVEENYSVAKKKVIQYIYVDN